MSEQATVRLVYASRATFEPQKNANGIEPNVARILMQSRRNNARDRIGGVLHFGDGYFFQCLEGERGLVNKVYQRIGEDPRHEDVRLLQMEQVDERKFLDWSMKYVAIESQVQRLLDQYGLSAFRPYEFNKQMIHGLLQACVAAEDPSRAEIPDSPVANRPRQSGGGFFRRLLGRG
ncbi:BLUF domain-containing protein [Gammaproteobacteria bacterium AB-CW1]|uniref:BLUF domain-containing protein n=1 Tax=Natronospira elongata TaxID=3110268 RepID=A0AAP6MJB9_9GAMM|nr:BLUF domain-containing protein [Gammaproteobacteria bacterium AB-CW1]